MFTDAPRRMMASRQGRRLRVLAGVFLLLLLVRRSMEQTTEMPLSTTKGGPVIMQVPGNMTVLEGQRVLLPCATEGFPNPIFYTWYKDNIDIRTTESYTAQRVVIQDDGSLLIKPAVKGDRGWYTCKPSNTLGHDEASAYLNVVYKPEVLKMPSQITWAKTYLQQIDCPVDSNPPLSGVTWIKDMTMLTTDSGRYDLLKNGTLLVADVEDSDAGSYRCIPTNTLGQGLSSPRVQVIVRDPPQITVSPQTLYIRNVGDTVQMRCEATGTPAVSLQWIKVGSRLEGDERVTINDKFLEIKNLTKDDHGKYECKAINQIATVVSVTELRIDNTTPHAPYNVTVTAGVFNVTVSWEPAYDGGTPQYYFLWFRPVIDSQWITMEVPGKSATFFNLYSLQPDTEYEFKILSRNALGDGSYSSVVRQRTLGYNPNDVMRLPVNGSGLTYYPEITKNIGPLPASPSNLTAQVRNRDILLDWKVPLVSPVPIFSYKIDYQHESMDRWAIYPNRVIDGSTSHAEMREMPSGVYDLRLRAHGVMAISAPSNTVRVTVSSDDLVLPEALIGGIIGGVLFLLVAVLLALVAIFHSRKKDRKAKAKYNDVNYGKPDEMNGRHEPPTKRDRWQHDGRGDVVTSLDNTDSIFFLPQTRSLDQSADMRASLLNNQQDARKRSYGRNATFREGYDQGAGRQVPLTNEISFMSDRSQAGSGRSRPDHRNSTWPDLPSEKQIGLQPRSLPPSYARLPKDSYPTHQAHPHTFVQPQHVQHPSSTRDHPTLSKSHSFPSHHPGHFVAFPPVSVQHPSQSAHLSSQPYPQPSRMVSSTRDNPTVSFDAQYPSFHSDDDDVFGTHPSGYKNVVPSLPRHSSMKPSQTTYLTDTGVNDQPTSGPHLTIEDISSVLEPYSEQPSQAHPNHSMSPSSHPLNGLGYDDSSNIPPAGYYVNTGDSDRPFAMVTPSQKPRGPSDNESNNSSGRPLGYTRDHLHGVVQRLREGPRPHMPGPSRQANVSGYSDPFPQSRGNLNVPPQMSKSHSSLQYPSYYNVAGNDMDNLRHRKPPRYVPDVVQDPYPTAEPSRQRALSEGSQRFRGMTNYDGDDDYYKSRPPPGDADLGVRPSHNSASYPDVSSLPRSEAGRSGRDQYAPVPGYYDGQRPQAYDTTQRPLWEHRRPPPLPPQRQQPNPPSYHHKAHPIEGSTFDPRDALPLRYTAQQPGYTDPSGQYRDYPVHRYGEDPTAHDTVSHSSGIGSRNTSQSTGSLHPRRGSAGKGSASFSSAQDPDLSLDISHAGGIPSHRRDTSGDENYEFDSLNALENDIIDDLRRYSRLSGGSGGRGYGQGDEGDDVPMPPPSKPSRYPNADKRFEKLREEFKQYQQHQHHPSEEMRPPPTAASALPIGQNGEPLYPMDSEML